MDIHEHGFLLLALMFIQNFARNPVLVNNRLSAASYLSQPLASNLAKSHTLAITIVEEPAGLKLSKAIAIHSYGAKHPRLLPQRQPL